MSTLALRKPAPPSGVPLSLVPRRACPTPRQELVSVLRYLHDDGVMDQAAVATILEIDRGQDAPPLPQQILSLGLATDPALTQSLARRSGLACIDPVQVPPDPALAGHLGAAACLRQGLLPWRRQGGRTVILLSDPGQIDRRRPMLHAVFGPVAFALATARQIEAAIIADHGASLRLAAETLCPAGESCRGMSRLSRRACVLTALSLAALVATGGFFAALFFAAVMVMTVNALLSATALVALAHPPRPAPPVQGNAMPAVSLIVALYHEAEIAPRLIKRLGRLDYPRDRLDVHLMLEEDDILTRAALCQAGLPPWMHVHIVPAGDVKTKPRALNYALPFCKGEIVGVFDAEDAPDPGQLHDVTARFRQGGRQLACLQGVLDFYNPRSNWLSRAFTLEYATWFRVILPGLARMGLPLPLGGTTMFLRRDALEHIGGWDAHNVTEDADLGIRLFRKGYRTDLMFSVTREEANCRPLPWVRQRSRWIKGYMMTWRVHMRAPRRLWQELGPAGFVAFQVLFLGSIGQAALGPVLASIWVVALGLPHPVQSVLLPGGASAFGVLCLACEGLRLGVNLVALRRSGHGLRFSWLATPHLLLPLAFFAAAKATWELLFRPFFWDKTQHGLSDGPI